jgi:O-antigen ligase/tetratricopeptide (TPR) repeat protein
MRGRRNRRLPSTPPTAAVRWAEQPSRLRSVGVAALCGQVALVPLVFDPSLDMPFVVSKALLSHGLSYVLAGVVAGLMIRFGRRVFVRSWLHVPVLAFLLASSAAALLAADPVIALYGTHTRMLGLGSIFDFVVLYLAIVLLVRTRRAAFAIGTSAVAASVLVMTYELAQMIHMDPFTWNIESAERPFSTLGEPTALAQYLTVLAIGTMSVGFLVDELPKRLRIALLMFSGLLLAGAAATGTRSSLLGLASGGAVLLLLVFRNHPNRRTRARAMLGALGASAIVALLLAFSPLGARLATIEAPGVDEANDELLVQLGPSAASRLTLYQIGLEMVRARPLLGYGPDNFAAGVPSYRPERAPEYVRQSLATSPHSWVVHIATSSGLVGLTSFIAMVVVAFALAVRGGFRPIGIAGAAMLAAFLGTGVTSVNEFGTEWLFWAAIGVVAAATATGPPRDLMLGDHPKRRAKATDSQVRPWTSWVLVALAAIVALTGVTALDASRSARASQLSRLSNQGAQAVDSALRSVRADPARSQYWYTLGLAYVASARWREAAASFDHASTLAPYDVRYIGDLARALLFLAQQGDSAARERALELADRAVRIDANNPRAHHTRAIVMQVLGNLPEAVRSTERALALDPDSRNDGLYVTATQVFVASGRANDAIDIARVGLTFLGRSRSSVGLRIELARALVTTGKQLEALSELDQALAIQPNEPTVQRLRAEIQASLPR